MLFNEERNYKRIPQNEKSAKLFPKYFFAAMQHAVPILRLVLQNTKEVLHERHPDHFPILAAQSRRHWGDRQRVDSSAAGRVSRQQSRPKRDGKKIPDRGIITRHHSRKHVSILRNHCHRIRNIDFQLCSRFNRG